MIIGSIPIGVFGLLFQSAIEGPARNLALNAVVLIVFALVLAAAERYGAQRRGPQQLTLRDGVLMARRALQESLDLEDRIVAAAAGRALHDGFTGSEPSPNAATLRRARGCALARALAAILIGAAGVHGRPGGEASWGPPAHAALRRLLVGG